MRFARQAIVVVHLSFTVSVLLVRAESKQLPVLVFSRSDRSKIAKDVQAVLIAERRKSEELHAALVDLERQRKQVDDDEELYSLALMLSD